MRTPKAFLTLPVALSLALSACSGGGSAVSLKSDDDKTWYAVGVMVGRSAAQFKMTPAQVELAKAGFADAAAGKTPQVDLQVYAPKVMQLANRGSDETRARGA